MFNRQRLIRLICWTAGIAAFVAVFKATGAEPLRIAARAFSLSGGAVLLIYLTINFWDVWGWRVVFLGAAGQRARFSDLFLIRLAGEAVNSVTPFVDIGGEFLKVSLAAKRFGLDKKTVLSTVVIERVALLATEVAFWFLGLAAALVFVPEVRHAKAAWIAAAVIFVPLVGALYWASHQGFFSFFFGLVKSWIRKNEALTRDLEVQIQDVDARISLFFRAETGRNAATLTLHLVGWIAGGFETWLMFRLAGADLSLGQGIMIEALYQLLKTASFFIPGNLGAQEAGLAYFGGWFGYAGPVGVAVSLLKRIRQLVWTGIGFAVWGWMSRRMNASDLSPGRHTKRPHVSGISGPR